MNNHGKVFPRPTLSQVTPLFSPFIDRKRGTVRQLTKKKR